jgi:hypothetical protein
VQAPACRVGCARGGIHPGRFGQTRPRLRGRRRYRGRQEMFADRPSHLDGR